MNLTPSQKIVALDRHRFRVLNCGRRWGKTTLAIYEMLGKAMMRDDQKIAYIAPTYQQARDIAWDMLKRIAIDASSNVNESRLELTVNTESGGTSTIYLRGWESVETLRGQRFDFLVVDEVAMMRNFWIGWQEVLRPTLTDVRGDALFISTPKGFNHWYDLYNTVDKNYASFKFTTYDNPHIPKEEIDEAKLELPKDKFFQEYMADFRKMEGLVYKEFDRTVHIVKEIPDTFNLIIAGQDFGYTNPFGLIVLKRDYDSRWYAVAEEYKTNKTNSEIVAIDKEYQKDHKISYWYPDNAEPDRIEEMRRAGLNCRLVSKDVLAGIDYVRELFKANRLFIHESCVNLISELETYRFKEEKPDKNAPEEPVKEDDHLADALRYALFAQKKAEGGAKKTVKRNLYNY